MDTTKFLILCYEVIPFSEIKKIDLVQKNDGDYFIRIFNSNDTFEGETIPIDIINDDPEKFYTAFFTILGRRNIFSFISFSKWVEYTIELIEHEESEEN